MFTGNKAFDQESVNFEFAVAAINRLKPAFVVITGDLINKPGDAAQIAEFFRIERKIERTIPVYSVVGNHDIENVPTPETVVAYTNQFGPDHYTFQHEGFTGLVLNSTVIHSPLHTTNELATQEAWLRAELKAAQDGGAKHIAVFQHHPWFLQTADEADQYFNIPRERRTNYLALFREFGVKKLFCGHYHRNAEARDGELECVTTGPVGMPLGGDKSGLRVVIVRDSGMEHRYYSFGEIPNRIELAVKAAAPAKK
jgi:3',5'-cyclic AMP phosphodiesterase CpdA